MSDGGGRMVMRSVYLPEAMDEELRSAAFKERTSKGELIRRYVGEGLARLSQEVDEHRLAQRRNLGQLSSERRLGRPSFEPAAVPPRAPGAEPLTRVEPETEGERAGRRLASSLP